jgi:hypothetical protein
MGILDTYISSIVYDSHDVSSKLLILSYYYQYNIAEFKQTMKYIFKINMNKELLLKKCSKSIFEKASHNLDTKKILYFVDWHLISMKKL